MCGIPPRPRRICGIIGLVNNTVGGTAQTPLRSNIERARKVPLTRTGINNIWISAYYLFISVVKESLRFVSEIIKFQIKKDQKFVRQYLDVFSKNSILKDIRFS